MKRGRDWKTHSYFDLELHCVIKERNIGEGHLHQESSHLFLLFPGYIVCSFRDVSSIVFKWQHLKKNYMLWKSSNPSLSDHKQPLAYLSIKNFLVIKHVVDFSIAREFLSLQPESHLSLLQNFNCQFRLKGNRCKRKSIERILSMRSQALLFSTSLLDTFSVDIGLGLF